MNKGNLLGIDLSKHSFQGCLLDRDNTEIFNRKYTRKSLINWLSKQKPMMVAIEACGSAHYWARMIKRMGHQVKILAPTSVTAFRLGHKTDATDARAIAIAARQPGVKVVAAKTDEQQGLQGVERIRQHLSDHLTATSNMIRGLLAEFGFVISIGKKALKSKAHDLLEDAENELPMSIRVQLIDSLSYYLELEERLKLIEKARDQLINQHECCRQLMQLESVGPVNAMGLYLSLGDQGRSFKNGREASACIGLTPKQYSTGGVVTMGGIGKKRANKRLRSSLVQGARSVVQKLVKRDPKNSKEVWLKSLIERRGQGRAAVALANKTIRVAWAMLHYGDDFNHQHKVSI
jgi:transposase